MIESNLLYFPSCLYKEYILTLQDGTFIVRDSTKIKGEFSLSLWFAGGVRHLRYLHVLIKLWSGHIPLIC